MSLPAIALFLVHESMETTNKYLVASVTLKRQTLESLPPLGPWRRRPARQEEDRLIQLLESLQRTSARGRPARPCSAATVVTRSGAASPRLSASNDFGPSAVNSDLPPDSIRLRA